MRIISDFKDYYDVIQKHGVSEPLYIRKETKLDNKQASQLFRDMSEVHKNLISVSIFLSLYNVNGIAYGIILFCGKLYKYVSVRFEYQDDMYSKSVDGNIYCYTLEKAIEVIKEKSSKYRKSSFEKEAFKERTKILQDFFNTNPTVDVHKLHAKYNSPIIHIWFNYWREEVLLNACLKERQFNTIVDPYTAFQELSMYLGGVLTQKGNEIVEITDDKVKIAKHGFDKASFRKAPETKAKRKKK